MMNRNKKKKQMATTLMTLMESNLLCRSILTTMMDLKKKY